jgi:hypothetical protein
MSAVLAGSKPASSKASTTAKPLYCPATRFTKRNSTRPRKRLLNKLGHLFVTVVVFAASESFITSTCPFE